jgi:hypothetical protein
MAHDVSLLQVIFTIIKLIICAFVLKVVLNIVGFTGYVPILDEVYAYIMKAILSISGNTNVLPHNFH